MFEAVGKKYWKVFFNILKESLSEEGSAALQIITIKDEKAEFYQNNPDFIQQYIFPGGLLPSKKQLNDINFQLGLKMNEIQNFSNSYATTLNIWNNKFQLSWPEIASQGFKTRFKKMWEYYLSYCEAGFIEGTTDVSHFIITK
jgi:Cyclopropane fatty acid synthase and related methyltransferases